MKRVSGGEEWARVCAEFDAMVDASREEQERRLDELAQSDAALAAAVRRMLHADRSVGDRLGALNSGLFAPLSEHADGSDLFGLTGRTIAHFEVQAPLGAGGMGVVYAARDTALDRNVALKFPLPHIQAHAAARRRFVREARAAAAIDHPNICSIHEVGESAGLQYLAMPLYDGETLRSCLRRRGVLPLADALAIADQVLSALTAAHEAGVVHRDLSPANLMLLGDGVVKVLDFGLASTPDATESRAGDGAGTMAYMAPEQLRGGESGPAADLWALGVVIYETLRGYRPERPGSETRDPLGIDGPQGEALEAWLDRLLAAEPSDRFATARDARLALDAIRRPDGGAESVARPPRRARYRRQLGLVAVIVFIAAVAGIALQRQQRPVSRNLVAVAPFTVADPGLRVWHEGIVDLLATSLDGAGPLRAVPPSAVLRHWRGRGDAASAAQLGAATGADLVIYGQLLRLRGDTLALRASILDRASGSTWRGLEVLGDEPSMGRLSDSLAVMVMRVLGHDRPMGSARDVSIGSHSWTALREFLQGEQYYRRGQYDSALVYFESALANDSTLALAHKRVFFIINWGPPNSALYGPSLPHVLRAVRLNHGLALRDSLVLAADSLVYSDHHDSPTLRASSLHRADSLMRRATELYPSDADLWYEYGEFLYHQSPRVRSTVGALDAFDSALALDSGFVPAYEHAVGLSFAADNPARAQRYLQQFTRLNTTAKSASGLRLAAQLLAEGSGAMSSTAKRASANAILRAALDHFEFWPDSAAVAILLLEELQRGGHDVSGLPAPLADSMGWPALLAAAYAFRGRLAAARGSAPAALRYATVRFPPARSALFGELARLGALPDSVAMAAYRLGPSEPTTPEEFAALAPRYQRALPWWYDRHDTLTLRRVARIGSQFSGSAQRDGVAVAATYLRDASLAYLALLSGDSTGAAAGFRQLSDAWCTYVSGCRAQQVLLARLDRQAGRYTEADEILRRWWAADGAVPSAVTAAFEQAIIAEQLHDTSRASGRYRFVADAWQHADTPLRLLADSARAALARLRGSRTTERSRQQSP